MASTKIVATVGPSSDSRDVLKKLFLNGLSTVRINTAHISVGYITKIRKLVDDLNSELEKNVGIMVDLKGPELRTGKFPGGELKISAGGSYRLLPEGKEGDGDLIRINSDKIFDSLSRGDTIVMSDGKLSFEVTEAGDGEVTIKSAEYGVLRDRARVNIPGRYLDLGVLTERDLDFVDEGLENSVEFFALSFVQIKQNVEDLQKVIMERGGDALIISKIETKSGLDNIHEISEVSDFIMVARGDLGVELPVKEVSMAQKKIIVEAHNHGVPTIVATQMLESMIASDSPTRAEVSDVTNAILDNADALMLSAETAIGKFPVEAVRYLRDIAEYVESEYREFPEPEEFYGNRVAFSIAKASKVVSGEIEADGILAFTRSGNTARMMSAVRPNVPIYAAVTTKNMANKLSLLKGVVPIIMPERFIDSNHLLPAIEYLNTLNLFRKGARLVITSGAPYFLFGGTNDVRVVTIGKFCGRGYPIGPSIEGAVTRKAEGKGDILLIEDGKMELLDLPSTFKGIILTVNVPQILKDKLTGKNITVLFNTKITSEIHEGQHVMIDGETGVVIS